MIESLFLLLQDKDPGGVYYLESLPLDRDAVGTSTSSEAPFNLEGARMFLRYVIQPAACIHMFSKGRRIVSIDDCHMYCRFDGVLLTVNYKDANNQTVTVLIAYVGNENKCNWQLVFDVVRCTLKKLLLVISDKAKGLDEARMTLNNLASSFQALQTPTADSPTIYAFCNEYAYANSGATGAKGRQYITSMAKFLNVNLKHSIVQSQPR